jgi:hypothetical protein
MAEHVLSAHDQSASGFGRSFRRHSLASAIKQRLKDSDLEDGSSTDDRGDAEENDPGRECMLSQVLAVFLIVALCVFIYYVAANVLLRAPHPLHHSIHK